MHDDFTIPETIPYGYCHCGCGGKTRVAKKSDSRHGYVKGRAVRYIRFHQDSTPPRPDGKKRCSKCDEVLDKSMFAKEARTPSGLKSHCKRCGSDYSAEYYYRNREAVLERTADYRQGNKEIISARDARYRRDNPEKMLEKQRNRRARKRVGGGRVSYQEWQGVLSRFDGKCAKCGSPDNIHMDHVVPLSRGGAHSVDNIQPLCLTCNSRKQAKIEDYRGKMYRPLSLPLDSDT